IRVAINARTTGGERWYEPQVKDTNQFRFELNPWLAREAARQNPAFDTSRYNIEYFRRLERLVEQARTKNVIVSILFPLDGQDPGVDPFHHLPNYDKATPAEKQAHFAKYPQGDAEEAYYRYAVARLSGFPNIIWDVTNEWHLFRSTEWVRNMAKLIRTADPLPHLISVHGHGKFPFRTDAWADYAMFQQWDESGGYRFQRKNRAEQLATGKPKPQVNAEYGYEDHYPGPWGGGRKAPARSADNRRRLAWEIVMAGGYATTGERGAGWLTGMPTDPENTTMLEGHRRLRQFCEQYPWYAAEPTDDLAPKTAHVLATPGNKQVAVYLPTGGPVELKLTGAYTAKWFNPRTGPVGPPVRLMGTGTLALTPPKLEVEAAAKDADWAVLLEGD
ncbi:MAG: DUF4038 domain-containing protein, partial [Gemmataceae bacterium]